MCVYACSKLGGGDFRLIYRHYATLYFVFCVDSSESELGILDLIQVFTKYITVLPAYRVEFLFKPAFPYF